MSAGITGGDRLIEALRNYLAIANQHGTNRNLASRSSEQSLLYGLLHVLAIKLRLHGQWNQCL
jgi:hypothetical protein